MSHLLIIEDEERMALSLQKGLVKAGFTVTVVNTGLMARAMNINEFDLVILDWMLPGFSGIDLLRHWRSMHYETPVLMLTAKSQVEDKVNALDFGADDYITKFFEWPELIARVNALLRRSISKNIKVGEIELDRLNARFLEKGVYIPFTATEYNILKYFFDHPFRLLSRTSIIRAVYDQSKNPYSNVIERHIKSIREKCNYDPIITIRGLGYRLNATSTLPKDED